MTADEIHLARWRLGLTQAELAAVMGLRRPQTISDWECGVKTPTGVAIRLLRAYLDGYRPPDWPREVTSVMENPAEPQSEEGAT
jgi:transcriptional regulator with XRE-family HTH domain